PGAGDIPSFNILYDNKDLPREPWQSRKNLSYVSEIHMSTDCKSTAPQYISEAPEVRGVDVRIDEIWVVLCVSIRVKAEIGMVQHIDGIDPKFKLFGFRNSHALDQVHVQSNMRRAFDPHQAKTADLSGRRIRKKKPAV